MGLGQRACCWLSGVSLPLKPMLLGCRIDQPIKLNTASQALQTANYDLSHPLSRRTMDNSSTRDLGQLQIVAKSDAIPWLLITSGTTLLS